MFFGALRSLIRPVSRTLSHSRCIATTSSSFYKPLFSATYKNESYPCFGSHHQSHLLWGASSVRAFQSLTDTRFPKRRPADKSRRKRASLRPKGPYAWVKHVPDTPIPANQPNVGSVKHRNEKKRIAQRRAFILFFNKLGTIGCRSKSTFWRGGFRWGGCPQKIVWPGGMCSVCRWECGVCSLEDEALEHTFGSCEVVTWIWDYISYWCWIARFFFFSARDLDFSSTIERRVKLEASSASGYCHFDVVFMEE